ncbi:MAG: helix-turn-helix domain-containing protein [Rhodospirillales bacterium]|jgi:SOS-response transcriptional repressor LexA
MQGLGIRIKDARLHLGITQQTLATSCGVSRAAVAQWENNTTNPTVDRLIVAAQILNVDPGYLLGSEYSDAVEGIKTALGKRTVPVLDFIQVALLDSNPSPSTGTKFIATDQTMGPDGFAIVVTDDSMAPEYIAEDIVFIDPDVSPRPGDIVVAHVLHDNQAVLRKYRPKGALQQETLEVDLVPLNQDWPTGIIDREIPGKIIGTVIEHRRYRKGPRN